MGFGFDDLLGIPTGGLYNVGKGVTGGYGGDNLVEDFMNAGKIHGTPEEQLYGGEAGGAAKARDTGYQGMYGSQAAATNYNNVAMDPTRSNVLNDREYASRGFQTDSMNLARNAALGNGPTAAQAQLNQGFNQAAAVQRSQAASARGAAGIAQAQGNAAGTLAAMQSDQANKAAILRAQEQQAGMNLYNQAANTSRGMDIQRIGEENQFRLGMGGLGSQYDRNALGWYGQAQEPMKAQLEAGIRNQENKFAVDAHNAGIKKDLRDSAIGMGGSLMNMVPRGGGGGGSAPKGA